MNCATYQELIEDLLDGEHGDDVFETVGPHIDFCDDCRVLYDTRSRAKEIYSRYLFEVEPRTDLLDNFLVRLRFEVEGTSFRHYKTRDTSSSRLKMFALRVAPAFAVLIVLGGIFLIPLQHSTPDAHGESAEFQTVNSFHPASPAAGDPSPTANTEVASPGGGGGKAMSVERLGEVRSGSRRARVARQTRVISSPHTRDPIPSIDGPRKQDRNLETEIAAQLERVEMLLRSFRNARSDGAADGFELGFEKRLARKLIEKNTDLGREAEAHGLVYAGELLSRSQPYLLEIARLGATPSVERVLEIKDRVGGQNLIASLQAYNRDLAP